jgi:hypothetical protein
MPLRSGSAPGRLASPDPKGLPLQEVRFIRDEVRLRVSNLIESKGLQSWALVAEVVGTTPNV